MNQSLAWKTEDAMFFITLLITTCGFIAYYFIAKSEKLKEKYAVKNGIEQTKIDWVIIERLVGVFFLGIVPIITVFVAFDKELSFYGISSDNLLLSTYWILGLSPLMVLMNYLNCKKADNLAMYPQIRVNNWSGKLVFNSAITWIAYLLAYEFLFRGYLLFVTLDYLGVWPAIAINASIYALVHVYKGIKEAYGAIPLGVVLCLITIQTGNIWVAFFVHVVLALTNEWFALWAQPDMKVVKEK